MKVAYTQQQLAKRVAQMGRAISKDYAGRTLDVVVVLEGSFLFAADLVRQISLPVICHFVRAEMRDVRTAGHERREVFFSAPPGLEGPERFGCGCGAQYRSDAGIPAAALGRE